MLDKPGQLRPGGGVQQMSVIEHDDERWQLLRAGEVVDQSPATDGPSGRSASTRSLAFHTTSGRTARMARTSAAQNRLDSPMSGFTMPRAVPSPRRRSCSCHATSRLRDNGVMNRVMSHGTNTVVVRRA